MTLADRRAIWAVADLVRKILKLATPLSIETLSNAVSKIGGKCIPQSDLFAEGDFDAYITTEVEEAEKNENVGFRIVYADWKPQARILFSIAHELGHFFLHLLKGNSEIKSETVLYRDLQASSQEWEANEFAAALLMPENEFIDEYDRQISNQKQGNNNINIAEIATYFNVSTQAATVRGQVLQLW